MFGIIFLLILLMLMLVQAKARPYPLSFWLCIQLLFFTSQKNVLKISIFRFLYFHLLMTACLLPKASLLNLLMLTFFVVTIQLLISSLNSIFMSNIQKLKFSTFLGCMMSSVLLPSIFHPQAAQFYLPKHPGNTLVSFSIENYLSIAILTSMQIR